MEKRSQDEMILSYNDVVLRRSDLGILSGSKFLNDRIIEFYFSYISSYTIEGVSLVSPSIAFWIANCPDAESLKDVVQPLNLPTKNIILFPVNNNDDVSVAEGGTHWSLLVYERNANVFVHHDSCDGLNASSARKLYRVVVEHVGGVDPVLGVKYVECDESPQQKNGYDCGLYVLAIARAVCFWYNRKGARKDDGGDGLWYDEVNKQVNFVNVGYMRCEISWLIKSLMDEKARV